MGRSNTEYPKIEGPPKRTPPKHCREIARATHGKPPQLANARSACNAYIHAYIYIYTKDERGTMLITTLGMTRDEPTNHPRHARPPLFLSIVVYVSIQLLLPPRSNERAIERASDQLVERRVFRAMLRAHNAGSCSELTMRDHVPSPQRLMNRAHNAGSCSEPCSEPHNARDWPRLYCSWDPSLALAYFLYF